MDGEEGAMNAFPTERTADHLQSCYPHSWDFKR